MLLSGNPLEKIGNTRAIEGVMVRGRWLESKELKAALEKVPAAYTEEMHTLTTQLQTDPDGAIRYLEEKDDPFDNFGAAALIAMVQGQDTEKLRNVVHEFRRKHPDSRLGSEQSVNALGYNLLGQKKYAEAIAVLRMNTEDFPKSANTWDSLGEAQFKSGDVAHAWESYAKALEVDPQYPNAEVARKFLAEHQGVNK